MNKAAGILNVLKNVIKYGAYIMVAIEIVQFAIDKIEAVKPKENVSDSK